MLEADRYHINVEGHLWLRTMNTKTLSKIKNISLDSTDTFVVTYPKSGTTWIQHVSLQLLHGIEYFQKGNAITQISPFIELFSTRATSMAVKPRLLKSHLDIDRLPWNDQVKYIYCVRNPKDVVVSYFYHYKNLKAHNFEGTFDEFFDMFIEGKVMYDSYFDHLLGYLPHIRSQNFLFLKYEEMLENFQDSVKKIALFLGGKALERLNDQLIFQEIIKNSSFSSMKEKEKQLMGNIELNKNGQFFRKGVKSGWINILSMEQSNKIDEVFNKKFKGTEAESWWKDEMNWTSNFHKI